MYWESWQKKTTTFGTFIDLIFVFCSAWTLNKDAGTHILEISDNNLPVLSGRHTWSAAEYKHDSWHAGRWCCQMMSKLLASAERTTINIPKLKTTLFVACTHHRQHHCVCISNYSTVYSCTALYDSFHSILIARLVVYNTETQFGSSADILRVSFYERINTNAPRTLFASQIKSELHW